MQHKFLRLVEQRADVDHSDHPGEFARKSCVLIVTKHPRSITGLKYSHDLCSTSEDAVRMSRRHRYIAVFIDKAELDCISTGTQLILVLRNAGVVAPICLMTSSPTAVDRAHALRRGANALIARSPHAIMQALSEMRLITESDRSALVPDRAPLALSDSLKKVAHVLADFTGPASEDQVAAVLQKHGENVSTVIFVDALASFITNPRDKELFVKQASREVR